MLMARYELARFFSQPRHLSVLVLLPAAVPAALSPFVMSPFLPAGLVAILTLSGLLETIDARERELVKFSVLPVRWEDVLIGKGAAQMVLGTAIGAGSAVVLCWIQPTPPAPGETAAALAVFFAVFIHLMHAGMLYSVRALRKPPAGPFDLLARVLMTLAAATLCAILPLALLAAGAPAPLLGVYAAVAAALWYGRGVPRAANALRSIYADGEMAS
jgi:hypothetical protein